MERSASEAIVSRRGWSRAEYEHATAAGVFGTEPRIELIDGEVVEMTPQGSRHFTGVRLVEHALRRAFGAGFDVRSQGPLAIADDSEPEPDVAVVEGGIRDYRDAHPTTAVLVVEVSDDSLRRDRTVKQRLYARRSIPEYWILALPDARLEVHRDPAADGYRAVTLHRGGSTVAPLARPEAVIAVAELLP
ncbi:MAG: Uma2 family endonuclease [Acidobacteria bacterium]|nr:Uma2 family endonuclease [Acidobacteriota bacterium]